MGRIGGERKGGQKKLEREEGKKKMRKRGKEKV